MNQNGLPDPVVGAGKKAVLAAELLGSVFPPLGVALRHYMESQLEKGLEILVDRIAEFGVHSLDDLTEGQREYLLPAAYRFAESVRVAEYEHNLRVIAEVIAGAWPSDNAAGDPNRVERAARRLSGLEKETLVAFANTAEAFERHSRDMGDEYGYRIISPSSLVSVYQEMNSSLSNDRATEFLVEISIRGLLIQESSLIWGATVYRTNTAYSELIEEAGIVARR